MWNLFYKGVKKNFFFKPLFLISLVETSLFFIFFKSFFFIFFYSTQSSTVTPPHCLHPKCSLRTYPPYQGNPLYQTLQLGPLA